jgi:hypothetical protein
MKPRNEKLHFDLLNCKCGPHSIKEGHKKQKRSKQKKDFYNQVKKELHYG